MARIYKSTGEFRQFFKDGLEPDIVITAGGTTEDIDDVRHIANSSTGLLGANLADQYYNEGYKVLLLATQEAEQGLRLGEEYKQYNYKSLLHRAGFACR